MERRSQQVSQHGAQGNAKPVDWRPPFSSHADTQMRLCGFIRIDGVLNVDMDQTVGVCSSAKILERTSVER